MSTTTIRIEDKLKERINATAERAAWTTHASILALRSQRGQGDANLS